MRCTPAYPPAETSARCASEERFRGFSYSRSGPMPVHIPCRIGLITVFLSMCTGCVSGRGLPVPPDRFVGSSRAPNCADPAELARKSRFAASRDPSLGLSIAATALDRARLGERLGYAG